MLHFFLNLYCHFDILIMTSIGQKWLCIAAQKAFRQLISTTVFLRVIANQIKRKKIKFLVLPDILAMVHRFGKLVISCQGLIDILEFS